MDPASSYLAAMSPKRAQQVLWICDAMLWTYLRCSQDSKSSPQPPSSICLETKNSQAWDTAWQATLGGERQKDGNPEPKSVWKSKEKDFILRCSWEVSSTANLSV